MRRWIVLIALIAVSTIDAEVVAQGCSQCRIVAEQASEGESSSLAEGLNSGIIYLMIIPYILLFLLFRKKIVRFFKELNTMDR